VAILKEKATEVRTTRFIDDFRQDLIGAAPPKPSRVADQHQQL
jgi:hypothetical protein